MIFLFAYLPTTDQVPAAIIALCERLANEFQQYIIRTTSLRKVFLSIKGVYYQAEIMGQDITWIVPYRFSQKVPQDVDFRIMLTFLEFYQTFIGFTNFKLYSDIGLVYPPKLDQKRDDDAAGINALQIEKAGGNVLLEETQSNDVKDTSKQLKTLGEKLKSLNSTQEPIDANAIEQINEEPEDVQLDIFEPLTAEDTALAAPQQPTSVILFKHLTIFLSREVPRHTLEFPLLAFGARLSWDPILGGGSPMTEDSETITHQIVDRAVLAKRYPGRSYVQPQWVVDSINQGKLLPTADYAPGAILAPHLSPFVHIDPSGYDPMVELDDSQEEDEEEVDDEAELQQELEAEAKGIKFSDFKGSVEAPKRKRQVEEEDLRNIMMSNKQKKLYKKMKYSNQKKDETAENLRKKRKELRASKATKSN
ncbi:Pescadillo [Neolecta irregularis DAH-3]|uniref:Pescadillo n=1 Tax=Neolecta irregularis (strain DAH-3) TaxID=1198029 RepID=A0A1U7LUV5_NEOID|nr:Pescadillo [Neolecta irregularis DAH-3]|eukprot:OLL26409.1 Pescadillo [Neolecta irregularis DAH-3]